MQIFLNYAASIINNDVLKNNCKVVLPSRRAAVFFKNICWQIKDSIFSLDEFINHCYQPQGKIIDNVENQMQKYIKIDGLIIENPAYKSLYELSSFSDQRIVILEK